jgi:hypothetical protein
MSELQTMEDLAFESSKKKKTSGQRRPSIGFGSEPVVGQGDEDVSVAEATTVETTFDEPAEIKPVSEVEVEVEVETKMEASPSPIRHHDHSVRPMTPRKPVIKR